MKNIYNFLASLKLTVVLIVLSIFFVFAGTLAQNRVGLFAVLRDYFGAYITLIPLNTFLPANVSIPGSIPFPGGLTLGILILLNLLCSQIRGFQPSLKTFGMLLIHIGLLVLLVGEAISSWVSPRGNIALEKGMSTNFYTDEKECELAFVEELPDGADRQISVPFNSIKTGQLINDPALPCSITIQQVFPNASVFISNPKTKAPPMPAADFAGQAREIILRETPVRDGNEPAALVTLHSKDRSLGTFKLSTLLEYQTVQIDGKTYYIQLRHTRRYLPFTLQALDFREERYLGTNTPQSYWSLVKISDPARGIDRQAKIEMNAPLRIQGLAFYQSGMPEGQTILAVVEGKARWLPYLVSFLGGLGLMLHFCRMLYRFLANAETPRVASQSPAVARPHFLKAFFRDIASELKAPNAKTGLMAGVLLVALCMLSHQFTSRPEIVNGIDLDAFGKLPIHHNGRIQPIDTFARNILKSTRGKETAIIENHTERGAKLVTVPATQWLLDAWTLNSRFVDYKSFRIDNPQILDIFSLPHDEKYFSIMDLQNGWNDFINQSQMASQINPDLQDPTQKLILEQTNRFSDFFDAKEPVNLLLTAPGAAGGKWQNFADSMLANPIPENAKRIDRIISAYSAGKTADFNREVNEYRKALDQSIPHDASIAGFEATFNRFAPFTQSATLYVIAFLLAALSWGFAPRFIRMMAIVTVLAGLGLHTYGILARMYITGRPPVINLASSAIFVGWIGLILGLIIEAIRKNGMGIALGCVVAFPTLFIAQNLALQGDTMGVLRAVLDTNIWLATHVVIIAIGYSATFLAGALGAVHIFRAVFKPNWTDDWSIDHSKLIYGITAFAMINSFIGTVLGGVWGDQSWGRFWGWDPKENGAAMIVLANALLLHARRSGIAGPRAVASLAVFGAIVTAWSWFGTNLMGVGLHSYGFTSGAAIALGSTIFVMFLIMILPYFRLNFSTPSNPADAK